jgi:hypothetical protein
MMREMSFHFQSVKRAQTNTQTHKHTHKRERERERENDDECVFCKPTWTDDIFNTTIYIMPRFSFIHNKKLCLAGKEKEEDKKKFFLVLVDFPESKISPDA